MASTLPPLHPAVETALADYYTASLAAIYETPVPTPEELPDLYAPLVPGAPPLLSIPPGSPLAPARAIFDLLAPVSPASQAACVQNYLRDLPLNPTIYHCCACGDSTDASGVHGGVHPLSELHFSKFDPTCVLHVEKMALYNALRALGEGRKFNDLCMLILRAELSLSALCTNQILASWQDCLCPHHRPRMLRNQSPHLPTGPLNSPPPLAPSSSHRLSRLTSRDLGTFWCTAARPSICTKTGSPVGCTPEPLMQTPT